MRQAQLTNSKLQMSIVELTRLSVIILLTINKGYILLLSSLALTVVVNHPMMLMVDGGVCSGIG